MSKNSVVREWQRYHAVHQAVSEFYDLQLRFPESAKRLVDGSLYQPPRSKYDFQEGDSFTEIVEGVFGGPSLSAEQDQENEKWHWHVRAVISCLVKVFVAGFVGDKSAPRDEELEQVADSAIGTIAGQVWRSLARVSHHHYCKDLFEKVNEIVRRNQELYEQDNFERESANV